MVVLGQVDYDKFWCDMREAISLPKTGDKVNPGPGYFGHILGGQWFEIVVLWL
ncbi:hypothetical protein BS47DRAFT_777717 [Hydnum rufescens UP504]|uniref:Uncharacterized protein n=1 Tax=Hydnum rufescens UP504 TaxID=1448309 RepID=A0A9P6ADF2_9AGAM|nr:hypothetical protein BS47DRAFT_777717 [Hydnum rufescens UP504]